jgi:hypothetical protein
MSPVIADLRGNQSHQHTRPEWQGSGRSQETTREQSVGGPGHQCDWIAQQEGRHQAVKEVIGQIGADSLAEDFEMMGGEKPLQGYEEGKRLAGR